MVFFVFDIVVVGCVNGKIYVYNFCYDEIVVIFFYIGCGFIIVFLF